MKQLSLCSNIFRILKAIKPLQRLSQFLSKGGVKKNAIHTTGVQFQSCKYQVASIRLKVSGYLVSHKNDLENQMFCMNIQNSNFTSFSYILRSQNIRLLKEKGLKTRWAMVNIVAQCSANLFLWFSKSFSPLQLSAAFVENY